MIRLPSYGHRGRETEPALLALKGRLSGTQKGVKSLSVATKGVDLTSPFKKHKVKRLKLAHADLCFVVKTDAPIIFSPFIDIL